MKVLLVCFTANGALGQYLYLLGKGFYKKIGNNVAMAAPETFIYKDRVENHFIQVGNKYRTRINKVLTLINPFEIIKFIKNIFKYNPKIVHVVGGEFHPWVFLVWVYCRISRSKLVLTVHDQEAHVGSMKDVFFVKIRNIFLILADRIHFLSSSNLSNLYIEKGKGFIVEHGSFKDLFQQVDKNIEKDIDFSFLGRLEYYKGIDILIEAIEICKFEPNTKIYICGPGKLTDELIKKIKKNSSIMFKNEYLDDVEFGNILNRTKNLVLPYRHVTQSSLPLIANYYSSRIIASNLGDFTNIIPKLNGILFETENPVDLSLKMKYALEMEPFERLDMSKYEFENQVEEFLRGYCG